MIWLRNADADQRWVGMARVLRQLDGGAFLDYSTWEIDMHEEASSPV